MRKAPPRKNVNWIEAPDIHQRVTHLVKRIGLSYIDPFRIYCVRSEHASARAYARIWGLSKVWQMALQEKPAYIIEVLSQHYDKLPERKRDEILLHELAHIPKNFSGALTAHTHKRKGSFHDKLESYLRMYNKTQ